MYRCCRLFHIYNRQSIILKYIQNNNYDYLYNLLYTSIFIYFSIKKHEYNKLIYKKQFIDLKALFYIIKNLNTSKKWHKIKLQIF